MSIKCRCPNCGAPLRIADSLAETLRACPRCGREFRIPRPDQSTEQPSNNEETDGLAAEHAPQAEDDGHRQVLDHLAALTKARSSWRSAIILLVISLVLFVSLGTVHRSLQTMLMLIGAIFLHEVGHLLGMKCFGYRNLQMLFIPYLGSVVAGRPRSIQGWKEAVVLLLGPGPGILLGLACAVGYSRTGSMHFLHAALLLISLNAFNLLPLVPLDGGNVLLLTLFSRRTSLEAVFRLLAAVLLGVLAWCLNWWALGIVVGFMLMSLPADLRAGRTARRLRSNRAVATADDLDVIPERDAVAILEQMPEQERARLTAAELAAQVWRVWRRCQLQLPGVWATSAIVGVYCVLLAVSPWALAKLFLEPVVCVKQETRPDGSAGKTEHTYFAGRLMRTTEVSDDNLYDGEEIQYFPGTDLPSQKGRWHRGRWHGQWQTFVPRGRELLATIVFNEGEFVSHSVHTPNGDLTTNALRDHSPEFQQWVRERQAKPPRGPAANEVYRSPWDYVRIWNPSLADILAKGRSR